MSASPPVFEYGWAIAAAQQNLHQPLIQSVFKNGCNLRGNRHAPVCLLRCASPPAPPRTTAPAPFPLPFRICGNLFSPVSVLNRRLITPRLKILAVRAARYLQILPLPRRPNLDVIRLRAAETHVPRAQHHHAIMQPQQLQHLLRIPDHLLQLFVAAFRLHDLDQLHLVKLMHANHPARPHSRRARFAPETRRVGAITNRQLLLPGKSPPDECSTPTGVSAVGIKYNFPSFAVSSPSAIP